MTEPATVLPSSDQFSTDPNITDLEKQVEGLVQQNGNLERELRLCAAAFDIDVSDGLPSNIGTLVSSKLVQFRELLSRHRQEKQAADAAYQRLFDSHQCANCRQPLDETRSTA